MTDNVKDEYLETDEDKSGDAGKGKKDIIKTVTKSKKDLIEPIKPVKDEKPGVVRPKSNSKKKKDGIAVDEEISDTEEKKIE